MTMAAHDWSSKALLSTSVFKAAGSLPGNTERALTIANNAYLRAEAVWKSWGITFEDVMELSPKFWRMHLDPVMWHDLSSTTLMTIHLNLALGTVGAYAKARPDLQSICRDLLEGKILGQFCLTEIGHGLDATNLETCATLQLDGTFDLHTPNSSASKFMPPTVPVLGRPCYGVVWAQLIVGGERRGVRPFLVKLNDGLYMSKGISSTLLPTRHGSTPINHAITRFTHHKIPSSSLLGEIGSKPSSHEDFLTGLWRVAVGTLALSAVAIPGLQIASYIAYKYSVRRRIGAPDPVPIISFRTQQMPIFVAVAQTYVLEALYKYATKHFADTSAPHQSRHAMATIFKSVVMEHVQTSHFELSERCGAQGLFDYNRIVSQFAEMRGISIAEGDILVLCIRLAAELLIGRYSIPVTSDPRSLLAQHEKGIFDIYGAIAKTHGHRSQTFSDLVLPRSRPIIEFIGHRMAYDAAVAEGVPKPLIDLYESYIINKDLVWYSENGLLTSAAAADRMSAAISAVAPHISEYVDAMGVAPYAKVPILSDTAWNEFVGGLYTFREAREIQSARL